MKQRERRFFSLLEGDESFPEAMFSTSPPLYEPVHPRPITKLDRLLDSLIEGIDYVFHLAGQPGVRASSGKSFDVYLRDNILATQHLLEAVRGRPIRKFVYASSSSIYGDAEAFPTSESALPKPVSHYGVSKLAAEHLCGLYSKNFGVPTVSLRYFTVYGPRQRPDMAFSKCIHSAMYGKAIMVYGDGRQTREFTFITDVVAANLQAADSMEHGLVLNPTVGYDVRDETYLTVTG